MPEPKKKPTTPAEYISQAPKHVQKRLREMRAILKSVSLKAQESIKWSVLTFSYNRILFAYAGFANHVGFYPTPAAMKAFEADLKEYQTGKSSIQFPHDKPLPKALIQKIAKFRIKDLLENDARWM